MEHAKSHTEIEPITAFGLTYNFRPSTSGLTIFEYLLPSGKGAPRHKHDGVDEVFVVVSGEAVLLSGETVVTLTTGDTACVNGGVEHAISGAGPDGVRLVAILNSAADAAEFYRQLSSLEKSGDADQEAIFELAMQHGVEITGPPNT